MEVSLPQLCQLEPCCSSNIDTWYTSRQVRMSEVRSNAAEVCSEPKVTWDDSRQLGTSSPYRALVRRSNFLVEFTEAAIHRRPGWKMLNDRGAAWTQVVEVTHALNRSAGVSYPRVFRGRSFNCLATALSFA